MAKKVAKKKVAKKKIARKTPPSGLTIEGSNKPFCFRCDPEEIEHWRGVAEAEGFNSLGTWIKAVCRARADWVEQNKSQVLFSPRGGSRKKPRG